MVTGCTIGSGSGSSANTKGNGVAPSTTSTTGTPPVAGALSLPSGAVLKRFIAHAKHLASLDGDKNGRIDVVSTTVKLADAVVGYFVVSPDIPDDMPVYMVIVQGNLTCEVCDGPPGGKLAAIAGLYDSSGNLLSVYFSGPEAAAKRPLDSATIAKLGPAVTIKPVQVATD
jgi:hypothetical protein